MSTKLDRDVNVTAEDQMKINTFARNNSLLQDVKEELEFKKKTSQNLDDAESDLMMMDDENQKIMYQIGEFFVYYTQSEALASIEEEKKNVEKELKELEAKAEKYKGILSDLKVQLYAKFGNNINLEAEED